MAKYRKKSVLIEALTFDELVAHGLSQNVPVYDGMPWSFDYKGVPVTHENNDCYIVGGEVHFKRGDMLMCDGEGWFSTTREWFDERFEIAEAADAR